MSKFLVYRASAGSGKTFMLVRKYLEQILQAPGEYRRILAVTFTNKAADEMKGRILSELDRLDRTPAESSHLDYLAKSLGKSGEWVQRAAGQVKARMLHDYSRISVGTIDSFFQQVLRSFARESGLSSSFQLELDTDMVLQKFSAYVFSEASSNKQLMDWLVEWVNDRMENREAWHKLESDLVRLGRELLKEDVLASFVTDQSVIPTHEGISLLRDFCRRTIREFNDAKESISSRAAGIINNSPYGIADFSNGMSGPAGTLLKLAESREGPKVRALESLNNPDKWVTKKCPVRDEIIRDLYPGLNRLMGEAITLYEEKAVLFNSARAANRNLFALGFAAFLFDFFRNYLDENDQLPISLAQPLVNQIIGDSPSPFIYEKTGTWYHHFLIDEFQDTSDLQWENFKPLIRDSLAAGGMSLIVGDVKQSLYRWRNSNWRLLQETAMADLQTFGTELHPLDTNQRSRRSVIDFNNRIFKGLPGIVEDKLGIPQDDLQENLLRADIIRQVFQGSEQLYGRNASPDGRVEIRFLDKNSEVNDWNDQLAEDLPRIIEDLLANKGYHQDDILFLVRKKADGDRIIRMLSSLGNSWTFVSADVFTVGNSAVIRMIINVMRFLADPGQVLYRDLFLWEVYRRSHGNGIPEPGFQPAELIEFQQFVDAVQYEDLLTLTDGLIRFYQLDLIEDDLPYIFQYRDLVKSCQTRGISHPDDFIQWWDASGHKQVLASESLSSSMRIMTIHKAKGLSSPVVIIPYCNWDFNHNATHAPWLWVATEGTPLSQVGMIPVRYESSLEQSYFSQAYLREKKDAFLDNLNLLYVAFTRAIDVLVVFCPFGKSMTTVADALLAELKGDLNEDGVFMMGDPDFMNQSSGTAATPEIHRETPMITGKMKSTISHRISDDLASTRFGKNIHQVLESVRTRGDLKTSIARSALSGTITPDEALALEAGMEQLFTIPELADWFSGQWEILNETGILVPGFGERRPDRIMIRDGEVVVVDYKTGFRDPRHENQVASYMQLLMEMGYREVKGYLLYIEEKLLTEVRYPTDFFRPDRWDPAS